MKLKLSFLTLLLVILIYGCSMSDRDILQKANNKLQKMTKVQYEAAFKNYNPMTGELGMNGTATAFFDFNNTDTIIGALYLFSSDKRKNGPNGSISFSSDEGFDGATSFTTMNEKKQLTYYSVKSFDDLCGAPFLFLSIQNIRSLLPHLLNDTAISFTQLADTLINNTDCYRFFVKMNGRSINNRDGKLEAKKNVVRTCALMVGKKDYLPRQFILLLENKSPLWIASYNNFDFSVTKPDSLFSYTSRNHDFKKYTFEEYQLVSMNENILKGNSYLGTKALGWTLPSMSGNTVSLSEINANLVMLDFWFPYCTGCVASIPEINEIQKKYKDKGLQVYGIEFTKPDSTNLTTYIKKFKIEYPTLYAGKEIAASYGVSAGPTIFLINREGKFVYAKTGFIKDELIKAIEANVK